MAKVELKTVQLANGETMGYREREGGKDIVILVHGNMISSRHWDLVIDNISSDFKVYAIDMRGFGISTYNQPIDSLKDFSEDLKLFVDELGLKGFSLVGWSTGGCVVMQFAADYPDYVNKLVMLESVSSRGIPLHELDANGQPGKRFTTKEEVAADPVRIIPTVNAYANRDKQFLTAVWNAVIYNNNQPSAELYDEYLDDMFTQRNFVDVWHALNTFNISNIANEFGPGTGDAARIQAPTLILWGRNDLVIPEYMALEIKEDIGDNAKLVYLENSGHSPLIDDLDQLLDKMTAFLKEEQRAEV